MRKIHIILLGMFGAGVLLGGIGTGIAFGEYSNFEYGGTVLLGEEHLVTKSLDYIFSPETGERLCLNYCPWGDEQKDTLIVEDELMPEGVVRYEVTYNSEELFPRLISWEAENTEEEEKPEKEAGKAAGDETAGDPEADVEEAPGERKVIFLELGATYQGNDFALLMEHKDQILEDIKKGKLSSYETVYITDVAIRVNPETMAYLEDRTK